MKFNLQIPKELQHLKTDERGFPIPYFAVIQNGKPDFRLLDGRKQAICIKFNKCSICGEKLQKGLYYFLGGPHTLANKVSTDTAMHRVCAEFSLQACPHLHLQKAERREAGEDYQKSKAAGGLDLDPGKPDVIFLILADRFTAVKHPINAGGYLIKFKPVSAVRYVYENNLLTRTENKIIIS